jgi:hypothetical protein
MRYKKYSNKQIDKFLEDNDIELDNASDEALKVIAKNCGIKLEVEDFSKPKETATAELIIKIRLKEE